MSGDLLGGGTPKRLVQRQGRWVLEVVRQVAIDRSVYRPHTQQLEGPDVILRYLKRSPQFKGLAAGAVQLLSEPSSGPGCFDAVNGEWVPSVLAPSYIEQLKLQRKRAAQRTIRMQLLDLQAECLRLRHAHAAVLDRVSQLEEQLGRSPSEVLTRRSKSSAPAATRTRSASADSDIEAEPESETGISDAAEQPGPAPADPPTSPEPAAESAQATAPRTALQISLPPVSDYVRCIEQLIGGDVSAKEVDDQINFAINELYISTLVDDEGHEAGAILMDIRATVFLGGTLLMVPEDELSEQVANNKPSEDSVAASSEVCSALSGSLNNVDGNPHLRSNFMIALDIAKHAWLESPKSLTYLADSFGGRVIVALR